MRWRESDGLRWLEAELPGARAAFSARTGGVSEGAFESLNLGILGGDDPGAVSENRRRLAVRGAFTDLGAGVTNGRSLNLAEATLRLLRAAGVERVEMAGLCTSCERASFFSHRRDAGRTGRQAGLVWIERPAADKGLSR
jgi:copper oxidase (laccase) domain-containing protein